MNAPFVDVRLMSGESDSRALGAAGDLFELLRLAQGAAQRLANELHGPDFKHAELIARDLRRLRRNADMLQAVVGRFVSRPDESAG
jgi:hypothetical protein